MSDELVYIGKEHPPNGFTYYDSATGWTMPNPLSQTMDTAAALVLQHDLANPHLQNRCRDIHCATRKLKEYLYAELHRRGLAKPYFVTQDDQAELQRLINAYVPVPTSSRCCGQGSINR
jgi:hypothetical protein